MQTTVSKGISLSSYVAAVGVVGVLAAVIVMAVIGVGGFGDDARGDAQSVSAPAISVSSDTLYAQEAAHDMSRMRPGIAAVPAVTSDGLFALEAAHDAGRAHGPRLRPLTSDAAYALEAEQIARQQTAQADRLTITSDEMFAIEAELAELNQR